MSIKIKKKSIICALAKLINITKVMSHMHVFLEPNWVILEF